MGEQVACQIGREVASGPLAQTQLSVIEQVIFRGQGDYLPARLNEREGGSTHRLHALSRRTYKKPQFTTKTDRGLLQKFF